MSRATEHRWRKEELKKKKQGETRGEEEADGEAEERRERQGYATSGCKKCGLAYVENDGHIYYKRYRFCPNIGKNLDAWKEECDADIEMKKKKKEEKNAAT